MLLLRRTTRIRGAQVSLGASVVVRSGIPLLLLPCRPMSTKTNQPRFPAQDMTVFGSGEHKLSWSSKQQEGSKADFLWSDLPEPHAERKKIIVDEFKEKVSSLNGPTWKTKYVVLFTVSLHLTFAYLLRDMAWTTWEFWLVSFNATVQCDGSCLVVGKRSVCLGPICYLRQCVLPF